MAAYIKESDHVFVAGQTGMGKSFLLRKYLAGYENVAVLDPKGRFDWPEISDRKEITIVKKLSDIFHVKTKKVVYRPRWEELKDEFFNGFFKWIYLRENTLCVIDEVMGVCLNPATIPEFYKAVLTRGRELGIGVWSASQRPMAIPQVIMSEASHFFTFNLNMPQDRKKMVDITGAQELHIKPGKHWFWYYHVEQEKAVRATLVEQKRR